MARENLPLLALFPSKPADSKKRDDPDLALFETLRGMLVSSNRFRTVTYSEKHPLIRRALLEHTLSVNDLTEPLRPEIKHQVARLLGARYILTVKATQDSESFKTDTQVEEAVGQQDWRTLFSEQITTAKTAGRKRLKFEDVVRITADGIITRMGLPSQLDASLRQKPENAAPPVKSDPKTPSPQIPDSQKSEPNKTTAKTNTEKTVKPSGEAQKPDNTKPNNAKTNAAKLNNTKPNDTKPNNTKPDEKNSSRVADNNTKKPERNTQENVKPPTQPDDAAFTPFTTNTAPLRQNDPMLPAAAPPPTTARVDFEAEAIRFRQAGDLANVITSLRHAINDRPRDLALRRQLVQAYLDRRLIATALAETDRAILIAPDDSPEDAALHRLRGDCLLAQVDVPGALKAYREAIRLAPNDIVAQVALGDALMADNQFSDALKVYETAAQTDPKSPLPHRRLARAFAGRAGSDIKEYAASLREVEQARKLTPAADTETYLEDYVALMRLMEVRMRDFLNEIQASYQAKIQGKQTNDQLIRATQDLKERASALADYLDKLPPALGQDATHARYQQGGALALLAVSLMREWLMTGETRVEESLKGAQTDALREMATARKRLDAVRSKL